MSTPIREFHSSSGRLSDSAIVSTESARQGAKARLHKSKGATLTIDFVFFVSSSDSS